MKKLVGAGGTGDSGAGGTPGGVGASAGKHTPLELQVVELKRKHPGILLMIEGVVACWFSSVVLMSVLSTWCCVWGQAFWGRGGGGLVYMQCLLYVCRYMVSSPPPPRRCKCTPPTHTVGYKFRFFGDDADIAAKVCDVPYMGG